MSSAVSSVAADPTSSACATVNFSEFPTSNIGCAAGGTSGVPDNYEGFFKGCCKSAPVESWGDGCALYCLSVGQSVANLTACLQDAGVNAGQIFCSGNNTATATSSSSSDPTASGDLESTSRPTASISGSGAPSGASGTAGSETGAAVAVTIPQAMSKTGLGVVAMLAVSIFAGAML